MAEAELESDRCSSEEQKTGMVTGFKAFANLAKNPIYMLIEKNSHLTSK
jgi:hypothetical protein